MQSLYEKKMVTYPRTDSMYLSNDLYPKIGGILEKLTPYKTFTEPLLKEKIRKSKKVFDDNKVTDHHAIIPTGVFPSGLGQFHKQIYDTITRRFLAAFHPDCEVSNTTVLGEVEGTSFKATGKQILSPGWRILYSKDAGADNKEEQIMPEFVEGESGPHKPDLQEKMTQPPKYYTEASLLRGMETAGKQVDDDELRDLMKENGIGRPSTRAAIIETLFRRKYIRREKKRIMATITGIQLIGTIQNELLKSAELTGQWEHKLRLIEKGEFEVAEFMKGMHDMVTSIVNDVKKRPTQYITITEDEKPGAKKTKAAPKPAAKATCPKCKEGTILKGKSAFGCSNWKNGCTFKIAFEFYGKKLTEKQINTIISKGKSPKIKGFTKDGQKVDGVVVLKEGALELEVAAPEQLVCPKCKTGTIISGNSARGCSNWKAGCNFRLGFEFMQKKLTDNQVKQLLTKGKTSKIKGLVDAQGNKVDAAVAFDTNFQLVINP